MSRSTASSWVATRRLYDSPAVADARGAQAHRFEHDPHAVGQALDIGDKHSVQVLSSDKGERFFGGGQLGIVGQAR